METVWASLLGAHNKCKFEHSHLKEMHFRDTLLSQLMLHNRLFLSLLWDTYKPSNGCKALFTSSRFTLIIEQALMPGVHTENRVPFFFFFSTGLLKRIWSVKVFTLFRRSANGSRHTEKGVIRTDKLSHIYLCSYAAGKLYTWKSQLLQVFSKTFI